MYIYIYIYIRRQIDIGVFMLINSDLWVDNKHILLAQTYILLFCHMLSGQICLSVYYVFIDSQRFGICEILVGQICLAVKYVYPSNMSIRQICLSVKYVYPSNMSIRGLCIHRKVQVRQLPYAEDPQLSLDLHQKSTEELEKSVQEQVDIFVEHVCL